MRRPAALTRARVLREALALLDREGLPALNMRDLAARLGVSPMALYNHVRDKEDLLEGAAALVIDAVDYGGNGGDWRQRLRACYGALRRACLAHPGIVRAVEAAGRLPVSIFRPMEITVSALAAAGMPPQEAFRAYCLLINFTMGQVSYEIRGPFPAVDAAVASRAGALSPSAFPASAAALASMGDRGWDFDAAFEFGLATILAGLDRRPRGAAR